MYDIIIIGAGPAGLTAGIYGCRASKKVLIFEAMSYGGQILNAKEVENYPSISTISGYDFANNLYNQTKNLGAEILFEKVVDIKDNGNEKEVITTKGEYKARTIIIATGAETRKLGLEEEDSFVGKGVSYCATCDGAFYKNKCVAVVGGGNAAISSAIYLSGIASKVYLIHRREEFRAEEILLNDLKKKNNIEYIYNSNVVKLNSGNNGMLENIEIKNKNGELKTIDVDGLFVAVGQIPENQNFAKTINLDNSGYVIAGEDCHTNIDGIFVAGDNSTKSLRQLVTATSDGAIAAVEAIKYLNSHK